MSLDLDFHTRVLKSLEKRLADYRSNMESCDSSKHDQYVGKIAATKDAISVVNDEFKRMGGGDE